MSLAPSTEADRRTLTWAMRLSLGLGILMLFIKTGAYLLTGSAAILSDAAESVVHVAAVTFAAYSLRLSYQPPDEDHLYGHAKIAFFSAGFEGAMIFLAAIYIIYESVHKWLTGLHLENLGEGTLLTAAASVMNGALGFYLLWVGRRKHSLILMANGKHVLTDCWTSLAVLVGLGLVLMTGWLPFDPICGILMALNILRSGGGLMKSAWTGLMDKADPIFQEKLTRLLDLETGKHGITYHQLRHRNIGDSFWVEVHLLFPEDTSLEHAHRVATAIENAVESALDPRACLTTHLESAPSHTELHPNEVLRSDSNH